MISTAIQNTLAGVVANTYSITDSGSKRKDTPYCLHTENELEETRTKEGVFSYNWSIEIFVVDDTIDKVNALTELIRTAMEGLSGTTVSSIQFDMVTFLNDDTGFDPESKMYGNDIIFIAETRNR